MMRNLEFPLFRAGHESGGSVSNGRLTPDDAVR